MSEFVSIKAGTGRRVSVSKSYADGIADVEVLDLPATNLRGEPLAPSRIDGRRVKPKTTVKKAAAKKVAASKSSTASPVSNNGGVAADPA